LGQDALYLNQYARALAALAAASTDNVAQVFWANSSINILTDEAELHRNWLTPGQEDTAGPVTNAYTDFLMSTVLGSDLAVGAATLLAAKQVNATTVAALPN